MTHSHILYPIGSKDFVRCFLECFWGKRVTLSQEVFGPLGIVIEKSVVLAYPRKCVGLLHTLNKPGRSCLFFSVSSIPRPWFSSWTDKRASGTSTKFSKSCSTLYTHNSTSKIHLHVYISVFWKHKQTNKQTNKQKQKATNRAAVVQPPGSCRGGSYRFVEVAPAGDGASAAPGVDLILHDMGSEEAAESPWLLVLFIACPQSYILWYCYSGKPKNNFEASWKYLQTSFYCYYRNKNTTRVNNHSNYNFNTRTSAHPNHPKWSFLKPPQRSQKKTLLILAVKEPNQTTGTKTLFKNKMPSKKTIKTYQN